MARKTLEIDNLGDLGNGTARVAVNKALRQAVADIADRGDDGKMREVNIKVSMCQSQGEIITQVEVGTKLPSLKTPLTTAKMQQDGQSVRLLFQADDRENPDQQTFEFPDPPNRVEGELP